MSMTIQQAIDILEAQMLLAKELRGIFGIPATDMAKEMAITALREKAEREDPKPLTYEELLQMHDELVWFNVVDESDCKNPHESEWTQVWSWDQSVSFFRFGNECDIMQKKETYGKTWICYRHKPKEV